MRRPVPTEARRGEMTQFCVGLVQLLDNTATKRFYGCKTTYPPRPGYLGSGPEIKKAVKELGRKNFRFDVVSIHDTEEEAYEAEKRLVTEREKDSPHWFNEVVGGKGMTRERAKEMGRRAVESGQYAEFRRKGREASFARSPEEKSESALKAARTFDERYPGERQRLGREHGSEGAAATAASGNRHVISKEDTIRGAALGAAATAASGNRHVPTEEDVQRMRDRRSKPLCYRGKYYRSGWDFRRKHGRDPDFKPGADGVEAPRRVTRREYNDNVPLDMQLPVGEGFDE